MITPITQEDFDELARTLDGIEFPGNQKALLGTIIHLASLMASALHAAEPSTSFSHQFATAFTPGTASVLAKQAGGIFRG